MKLLFAIALTVMELPFVIALSVMKLPFLLLVHKWIHFLLLQLRGMETSLGTNRLIHCKSVSILAEKISGLLAT